MDRPSTPSLFRLSRKVRLAGFGQVQLVLALVCVVLAACLLFFWQRRHQMTLRCDAYVEDVRGFASASRKAFEKHGAAPPGGGALPVVPLGMEPYVSQERWLQPTPFGGNYHWLSPFPPDAPPPSPKDSYPIIGAIQVNGFPPRSPVRLTEGEIAYLEARFAEKAVPGVKLIFGFNGWPICIVYATP
jgi:hypothetical protein